MLSILPKLRSFSQGLPSISTSVSLPALIQNNMYLYIPQHVPHLTSQPAHGKTSNFQHRVFVLRRELRIAKHVAMGSGLLFIAIFLLGIQSALSASAVSNHQPGRLSLRSAAQKSEPPIHRQLHQYHAVPKKILRLMTSGQQHQLLLLLATPSSTSSLARPHRYAVFAQISGCRLSSCLRAIASAVTYAQVTGRVAVVFVNHGIGRKMSQVIKLKPHGVLNTHAMVVAQGEDVNCVWDSSVSYATDWAEFSVIHAVAPSSFSLNITAPNTSSTIGLPLNNPRMKEGAFGMREEENLPKIGNTKKVATLDNLAAINTHVSVTLGEVFWSSYAPRSAQEGLFENELTPTSRVSRKQLDRASLLGRRYFTRSITIAEERLHVQFQVPRMLLKGMTPLGAKLLLLKLEGKRRLGNPAPRAIFVHAQYGLGNRLRALGSAMAFARRTNRVLVLIWVPDQHLNCRYTDLFVGNDEFVVSDSFEPQEEWPFTNNAKSDEKMKSVKWYNFMRVNGVQVNSSTDPVTDDKDFHIYVSTCYVIQSPVTPFIIRTTSSFWHVLRSLTPQVDVVRLVERFSSYPLSEMIGIHIRGKSIKTDISGVTATNYTEESSRTTDYWRNLTQVDTFIEEMRRQTADQLFYVAADSKDVFNRLEREFPSRVFYTPRHCDSRDRECLPFALADILLLAKCSSLRGSYWSSFSELSTRIGGARFLLAGIDFGRPDRQLF